MAFLISAKRIGVVALELEHDFGKAKAAGIITLAERNPHFDITADFGMSQRERKLWPITISPNGRKWTRSISGGALRSGSLSITASLQDFMNRKQPIDAPRHNVARPRLREYRRALFGAFADIEHEARLKLRGSSMEVTGGVGSSTFRAIQ